tara:strand:+ start:85890 stop:86990 length:1101 start_codon:yes stop_codon:yes gene_type:complete
MKPVPLDAKPPHFSSGAAILIFITLILLAATSLLVVELSVNQRLQLRTNDKASSLGEAQQALLGYALAQAIPGTLPCPDSTGDGLANPNGANCQSQLGLLPTRTLNLPELDDGSGAKLWYAVDLNYVGNATALKNSSVTTTLRLDARTVSAVVIAPGPAVDNQSRQLLVRTDFLEGLNADADLAEYESTSSASQNDRIVGIDVGRYWALMERRVLIDATQLLNAYRAACNEYPWAANFGGPYTSVNSQQNGAPPLNTALPDNWGAACAGGTAPTPATYLVNHWIDQLYYGMCTAAQGNCLTVLGSSVSPVAGILLAPGIALASQTRPDSDPGDYFEAENDSLPTTQFRQRTLNNHTSSYNDITNGF